MRISLCQLNPTVGAVFQNLKLILEDAQEAYEKQADIAIFPELAICGYPPKDLIFSALFMKNCESALLELARETPLPVLLGSPSLERHNAAYFCSNGRVQMVARKQLLPNYQVFDEQRYFKAGSLEDKNYLDFKGCRLGISICEDAWALEMGYPHDPLSKLVHQNQVDLLINLMASPFEIQKTQKREAMFCRLAQSFQKPFYVAGQVGANDGLIFEGGTLMIDAQGQVFNRVSDFQEGMICS